MRPGRVAQRQPSTVAHAASSSRTRLKPDTSERSWIGLFARYSTRMYLVVAKPSCKESKPGDKKKVQVTQTKLIVRGASSSARATTPVHLWDVPLTHGSHTATRCACMWLAATCSQVSAVSMKIRSKNILEYKFGQVFRNDHHHHVLSMLFHSHLIEF